MNSLGSESFTWFLFTKIRIRFWLIQEAVKIVRMFSENVEFLENSNWSKHNRYTHTRTQTHFRFEEIETRMEPKPVLMWRWAEYLSHIRHSVHIRLTAIISVQSTVAFCSFFSPFFYIFWRCNQFAYNRPFKVTSIYIQPHINRMQHLLSSTTNENQLCINFQTEQIQPQYNNEHTCSACHLIWFSVKGLMCCFFSSFFCRKIEKEREKSFKFQSTSRYEQMIVRTCTLHVNRQSKMSLNERKRRRKQKISVLKIDQHPGKNGRKWKMFLV